MNSYTGDRVAPKRVSDNNAIKVKDAKAGGAKTEEKKAPQVRDKETDRVEERDERAAAQEFKAREQEVIAHEQAHSSAGGSVTGSPSYTYTRGPDGSRYISGGGVSIDTSRGSTPEETIEKMRQVRAAALAPADSSAQDRAVAARAATIEAAAKKELAEEEKGVKDPSATDINGVIVMPVNEHKKGEVKVPANPVKTVQEEPPADAKRISVFA
jgi:hypothetical protein